MKKTVIFMSEVLPTVLTHLLNASSAWENDSEKF
jgi:hypothetical protein